MQAEYTANHAAAGSQPAEDTVDLGAILGTIWRGKWLIALCVALFASVAGYYAFRVAVPTYVSSTVLLLEPEQEPVIDLQSVFSGASGDTAALNTEVEVLRSRGLIGRVVDVENLTSDPELNERLRPMSFGHKLKIALGLADSMPQELTPQSQAAQDHINVTDALIERLFVRNLSDSFVFNIEVTTENPEKSARIADSIAQQYILNQLDVKFEATHTATTWLSGRVAELKVELEAAEAALSAFSSSSTLVNEESLQAFDRQLKDLRERVEAATTAQTKTHQRLNDLRALEGKSRTTIAAAAQDRQLTGFVNRFENPDMRNAAQAAFDTRFAQVLARSELEASRATSQLVALSASVVDLEEQIGTQSQDLIILQQLSREAEASRLLYEYFLGRLKEISAQEGIQQADSRVISKAVEPSDPDTPRKPLIVIIAMIFGGMVGVIFVLFREARNNTFRTVTELELATGQVIMGQIPLLPTKSRENSIQYLADKPTSAGAEAIRNLRTSVLLSSVDKTPKIIMSTSSLPGEGKTTISFALAQNLSAMGKSVLLVEGDLRRRVFTEYVEKTSDKGLLSVITEECTLAEAVQKSPLIGADILLGEESRVNAADVLSSDSFKAVLAQMCDVYDHIIIDTPPVLVVPDARIIAQLVDIVLFTVRWDKTTRPQVEEALRMFETVGRRVNGVILNQVDPKGMKRYGYGESYGAYSAYGTKYYTN